MLLDILKTKMQRKTVNLPVREKSLPEAKKTEKNEDFQCPSCGCNKQSTDMKPLFCVCPKCGYHGRMTARERFAMLLDPGTLEETGKNIISSDPLSFPEYPGKLDHAIKISGEVEAVITGLGKIKGIPVGVFAMEPDFMMGSLGSAAGERITSLIEMAIEKRMPVIGFCASGGARMQEGILSLMQMAKTSSALGRLGEEKLPYFSILTDPTTGGVTASFAMLGDVILAEPGALIGFAGPRVIEQVIRQKLPDGFQRAEFLLERGFVDLIVQRPELRNTIARLLVLHGCTGGDGVGANA